MSVATWIEVSASAGSREALVRCAIDLLSARGTEVVRAGPIEAMHAGLIEAMHAGLIEAMHAGPIQAVREVPPPGVLGALRAPAGAAAPKSLASLAQGAERPGSLGADALPPPPEDVLNTNSGDLVRCLVAVRGEALVEVIDEVRAALEGRVQIARSQESPAAANDDAASVAGSLAGFVTEAIDHTADEAFAVTARDRADLLAAAAEALGALMVGPASVRPIDVRPIDVRAPEESWADDDRLFAWLCEVLYALDVGRMALRRAVVFEDDEGGVRGALFGEPIDEDRHEVHGALKAVTYHGLAIEPAPGGVRAQVVVDV